MKARRNKYTSASQLAQMAVCEHQVLLRSRMGDLKTAQQAVRSLLGNEVHERIHQEGHTPYTASPERTADTSASAPTGRSVELPCPQPLHPVAWMPTIIRALMKWILDIGMGRKTS